MKNKKGGMSIEYVIWLTLGVITLVFVLQMIGVFGDQSIMSLLFGGGRP